MKFSTITFLEAAPSPKDKVSHFTFGHDGGSFNGGYDLEEKGGWIHITWPATGATHVMHPSRVRHACALVDKPAPKAAAKVATP